MGEGEDIRWLPISNETGGRRLALLLLKKYLEVSIELDTVNIV